MENICDWKNCKQVGNYKAPVEKDNSRKFRWLCLVHIKEFNKSWDYFNGMSEDQTERLFRVFGKLDDKAGVNREGIGLGLSITRNLIRHLGGDIDLKSKLGQGTKFTFYIHYETDEASIKSMTSRVPCVRISWNSTASELIIDKEDKQT